MDGPLPARYLGGRADNSGGRAMGVKDWIRDQFIEIIEYLEPSQNEVLAYRFTRSGYKNETL